jgi:methyl-accepting chemotaxis protein
MYQYIKNIRIRNLILITVIFFSALIFAFVFIYLSINVSKANKKDSMAIVDRYTQSFAIEITGRFNEVMGVARTLTKAFAENIDEDLNTLHPVSENILKSVLKDNPEYISVWFDWEISVIDPSYKRINGRVANIALRKDAGITVDRVIMDTTNNTLEGDYYYIKKTNKEVLGEPYYDEITPALKGILMLSPCIPIVLNNKFAGIVGIDLDMTKVQQLVQSIKPYNNSLAYLLSPSNTIVAHTDATYHKKSLLDVYAAHRKPLEDALEKMALRKPFAFIYPNEFGREIYVSMVPMSIGRDNELWVLATETPIEEVLAESKSIFIFTFLVGLAGIIVLCFIVYFLLNYVLNKLNLAIDYSSKIAKGDLSLKMDADGKNEISGLSISLNQMADKIKQIIYNVTAVSEKIGLTSNHISEFSLDISEGASNQAASSEQVMASIEQMSANILNNAEHARQTEIIAQKALQGIISGTNSARQTQESIHQISQKISIIQEISHQTNILALNAAVEAARAGLHGKGFAVVANEVKKLAEKAQLAAKQITELAFAGVHISDMTEKDLSVLVPDIEKTAVLIREIANASNEQSTGTVQIQNVIQQLNDIAQKNASNSEKLSIEAKSLQKQAFQLNEMIKFFKL